MYLNARKLFLNNNWIHARMLFGQFYLNNMNNGEHYSCGLKSIYMNISLFFKYVCSIEIQTERLKTMETNPTTKSETCTMYNWFAVVCGLHLHNTWFWLSLFDFRQRKLFTVYSIEFLYPEPRVHTKLPIIFQFYSNVFLIWFLGWFLSFQVVLIS